MDYLEKVTPSQQRDLLSKLLKPLFYLFILSFFCISLGQILANFYQLTNRLDTQVQQIATRLQINSTSLTDLTDIKGVQMLSVKLKSGGLERVFAAPQHSFHYRHIADYFFSAQRTYTLPVTPSMSLNNRYDSFILIMDTGYIGELFIERTLYLLIGEGIRLLVLIALFYFIYHRLLLQLFNQKFAGIFSVHYDQCIDKKNKSFHQNSLSMGIQLFSNDQSIPLPNHQEMEKHLVDTVNAVPRFFLSSYCLLCWR